jgi:hypothetical protein
MAVSDALFKRRYPDLKRHFTPMVGNSIIYGTLYICRYHPFLVIASAMFKAACDGTYNYCSHWEYGEKASYEKDLDNGFQLYTIPTWMPNADGLLYHSIWISGKATGRTDAVRISAITRIFGVS